jgi:hypothetical protein
MNKSFFIGWIVIFVAWMLGSFVVHGTLLHDDYSQLPNLFRPEEEAQKHMPLMILAHIILSGAFVWIYSRGISGANWLGQGVRFGVAVALLSVIPMYIIYYVVQPMPSSLVVKQVIFDGILLVLLGVIVAFVYRRPAAT